MTILWRFCLLSFLSFLFFKEKKKHSHTYIPPYYSYTIEECTRRNLSVSPSRSTSQYFVVGCTSQGIFMYAARISDIPNSRRDHGSLTYSSQTSRPDARVRGQIGRWRKGEKGGKRGKRGKRGKGDSRRHGHTLSTTTVQRRRVARRVAAEESWL